MNLYLKEEKRKRKGRIHFLSGNGRLHHSMHCNKSTRKISKRHSGLRKRLVILQNFSGVDEFHLGNSFLSDKKTKKKGGPL